MPLVRVRPAIDESQENPDKPDEDFGRASVFGYVVQKYANETTFHGFRNVFDTESSVFRRLLWLFVLLGCTGFCIQQFYQRVTRFTSQPASVDIDINYPSKLTFPKVIFCNNNQFNSLKIDKQFYDMASMFLQSKTNADAAFIAQLEYIDNEYTKQGHPINLTLLYYAGRHYLSDMLQSCTFRGKTCSESDFRLVYTDYGICYQFVGDGTDLEISSTGFGSGLTVTINVEQYAYMSGDRKSAGILLSIQAPHEVPMMTSKGIAIPVGNEVLVALDLTQVRLINQGENKCTSAPLLYNDEYSTSACKLECLSKYVVDNCGCREGSLPGNASLCKLAKFYTCAYPLMKNFSQSSAAEACYCQPACTEFIYSPQTTISPFSTRFSKLEARRSSNNNMFFDYIRGTDLFENYVNQQQAGRDDEPLGRFAPYYADYVRAASSLYPVMTSLLSSCSSARRLAQLEVTLPTQVMAKVQCIEGLATVLNSLVAAVDPTKFDGMFKYARDVKDYLMTFNLYYLGRRLTFNRFRFDAFNDQNATTFLWLQANLGNMSQEMTDAATAAVQLISSIPATTQRAAWDQLVGNISTLLPQVTQAASNLNRTVHVLVEDGLKPMNSYISASVPKLSLDLLDVTFLRENFLTLDIFFGEMRYTSIQKQMSDNTVSLICDLGGTFGLFMGASIMSLYEFVDFLLHLVGSHINH